MCITTKPEFFRKIVVNFTILLLIVILLPSVSAQEPVISLSHSTLPETPMVGEPFVLNIFITNTGTSAEDVKITAHGDDENLVIISENKESSSQSIVLGELPPGSAATGFKMMANKDGIYRIEISIRYSVKVNDTMESHLVKSIIPLTIISKPSFKVLRANPISLQPGTDENLILNIENSGGTAKDVHIRLVTPSGLIVHSSSLFFDRWNSNDVKEVQFTISADENLPVGSYPAYLILQYSDELGYTYQDNISLAINIFGIPEITFSGFSTSPDRIYPDSDFDLMISLQNTGKDDAENVVLNLEYPDGFTGEKEKYTGTIKRGEIYRETFKLKTEKELEPGTYRFNLKVSYRGDEETVRVEYPFSIFIDSPGDIVLEIGGLYFSPQRVLTGKDFTLSLQVENAGKQDARAVSVKLILPEEFSGKNIYFIGSLESGDSATSTFDLIAPKKPGEYRVKAQISYLDYRMDRHTVEKEFSIYIFPEKSYLPEITGAIVMFILLSGLYLLKKRERR